MTAEIAIMNKSAVALAADSAVTSTINGEQKIYLTMNKLFSLSKYQPVGIMVYGNAEFMGVDWETIVKIYRRELGDTCYSTLREHAYKFLEFLASKLDLFDEQSQIRFVMDTIGYEFSSIYRSLIQNISSEVLAKGGLSDAEIREKFRALVTQRRNFLRERENFALLGANRPLAPDEVELIHKRYEPTVRQTKKEIFGRLPTDGGISRKLSDIALYAMTKDLFDGRRSGVVIAGYGTNDIFPSLEDFGVYGILHDWLKFKPGSSASITQTNKSSITAFAQREMVAAFMLGIDPEYAAEVEANVRSHLVGYGEALVEVLLPKNAGNLGAVSKQARKAAMKVADDLQSILGRYSREAFTDPVIKTVANLPKPELAAMAESLVNLTSFRRHVTPDAETVGGPIDVAIISRSDGFVWIKRKHYFQPELNPHFMTNYYR